MYNLHVANMRNKYSNERQKLARMYVWTICMRINIIIIIDNCNPLDFP
jgi:hypothetical protein